MVDEIVERLVSSSMKVISDNLDADISAIEKPHRQKIRKAMLMQADKALASLYPIAAQRHAAARVLVDRAIKKEMENGKVVLGNA